MQCALWVHLISTLSFRRSLGFLGASPIALGCWHLLPSWIKSQVLGLKVCIVTPGSLIIYIRKAKWKVTGALWARGIAQWLGVLPSLPEDPSLVPSTMVTLAPRDRSPSSGLHEPSHTCGIQLRQTPMHGYKVKLAWLKCLTEKHDVESKWLRGYNQHL